MLKLTETFACKILQSERGTRKLWDAEIKGLVLFVGKQSKTRYFQKDIGGLTQRVLIGRYPTVSADTARQTAMGFALEMSRGAGLAIQIGAATLSDAPEACLARPKLRSEAHKLGKRQQFDNHLRPWLKLPLDEISRSMVVERHRALASAMAWSPYKRLVLSNQPSNQEAIPAKTDTTPASAGSFNP